MPPQAISLGLLVIEEAIKNEPAIAQAIKGFFTKAEHTPAEWQTLRDAIASRNYSDFDPSFIEPGQG